MVIPEYQLRAQRADAELTRFFGAGIDLNMEDAGTAYAEIARRAIEVGHLTREMRMAIGAWGEFDYEASVNNSRFR